MHTSSIAAVFSVVLSILAFAIQPPPTPPMDQPTTITPTPNDPAMLAPGQEVSIIYTVVSTYQGPRDAEATAPLPALLSAQRIGYWVGENDQAIVIASEKGTHNGRPAYHSLVAIPRCLVQAVLSVEDPEPPLPPPPPSPGE